MAGRFGLAKQSQAGFLPNHANAIGECCFPENESLFDQTDSLSGQQQGLDAQDRDCGENRCTEIDRKRRMG
jgi:hypothetical protein